MAEPIDPSSPGSVTPTGDTPVTGTPASSGVMPPTKPTLTLEEALKRLTETEHSLDNAKAENDRHSKRLSAYEKVEKERAAAEQAAKDAQLSEVERVKKLHADAEAKIKVQHQQLITAQVKLAAHAKGIIDPELAALAIQSQIADLDFDDAELADRIDKALDKLLKNKPYLAPPKAAEPAPEQAPATPAQTAPTAGLQTPAIPVGNPGRSYIPAPGTTTTPGKPVRLSDIQWKGRP